MAQLTDTTIQELRRLIEAATPGEYHYEEPRFPWQSPLLNVGGFGLTVDDYKYLADLHNHAEFLIACAQQVRELLDEYEKRLDALAEIEAEQMLILSADEATKILGP